MCEQCGKLHACEATLKQHIRYDHEESKKEVKCNICLKLVNERYFGHHVKRHETVKSQICTFCGQSLGGSVYALKKHVNSLHTKERQYPCDLCPKIFKEDKILIQHKNVVHFKQKTYKCKICDRSFGASRYLKIHSVTHTGKLETETQNETNEMKCSII